MSQSDFVGQLFERKYARQPYFPDKNLAAEFIDSLFSFLFTPFRSKFDTREGLEEAYENLGRTFSSLVFDVIPHAEEVEQHRAVFFSAVPVLYGLLLEDAEAVVRFDPAAGSVDEVLVAYPGFYATVVYRLAHQLYLQDVPTLPRILSEHAHSRTGIDIHPGAQIGRSFFIDHGTGIVIGESAAIGDHVKIYQGVTLGALNVAKEHARKKRHPTIGDHVVIYSGATILGGETVIGHHSIIGGNVWLTSGVEPYSVVYHKSEVVVRDKFPLPEPLNFVI